MTELSPYCYFLQFHFNPTIYVPSISAHALIHQFGKIWSMVFYTLGRLVTFLVIWFSICSVLWIWSNGPALISNVQLQDCFMGFYIFHKQRNQKNIT